MRFALAPLVLTAVALLLGGAAGQDPASRTTPYPEELVEAFARLPVQDGGRIKPLDTLARFVLLRLSERRSVRIPDEPRFGRIAGSRLGPTEWVMDVVLFPEQADGYPVFLITDRDLLEMVGLGDVARQKRDRYSFRELAPGIATIQDRARAYFHTEEKNRTRLQNQLVHLHQDLVDYQGLRGTLDAARARVPVPPHSRLLRDVFGDGVLEVRYSTAARHAHDLLTAYQALSRSEPADGEERQRYDAEAAALDRFLSALLDLSRSSSKLSWLPPADPQSETWLDARGVFAEFLADDVAHHAAQIEAIATLEAVADASRDLTATTRAARAWVDQVTAMALARGEGRKLALEVAFYRHDHFWRAQWSFVLGFVCVLLSFFARGSRVAYGAAWALTAIGAALVVWGITERCILRERPPVSTLYETILLVAGSGVIVAMVLEAVVAISRAGAARGVALGIAALTGALGMFLAASHETFNGEDTMPQLQAVLDTNFWLATHVTTVTLGYMAGLR